MQPFQEPESGSEKGTPRPIQASGPTRPSAEGVYPGRYPGAYPGVYPGAYPGMYPGAYPAGSYGYPAGGYGYGPGYPEQGRVHLKRMAVEFMKILRRGRWIIPVVAVAVLALVAAYAFLQAPTYQAYSLIAVDGGQARTDYALSYGFVDGSDLAVGDPSTQALLLSESIVIAESTATRLLDIGTIPGSDQPLPILKEVTSSWSDGITGLFGGEPANPTPTVGDLALALQDRYVRVKTESRGEVLRVGAESSDPIEAMLLANLFSEAYVGLTLQTSRDRIAASRRFLESQVEKSRQELEALEEQTKAYVRSGGVVSLDGATPYTVGQLAELEAERDQARVELNMLQASLSAMEREFEEIRPKLASGVASSLEQEIQSEQEKIAELELIVEQIYTRSPGLREDPSSSPRLVDLLSQISQARDRVFRLSQQYVEDMLTVGGVGTASGTDALLYATQLKRQIEDKRIEINSAQARLDALERRTRDYEVRLRTVPEQTIGLEELRRDRDAAERRYLNMVDNLEQVRMAEASEIGVARIMRPAIPPEEPIGPGEAMLLALGLMLGLMLGFLGAVVRHKMDTRIYAPDDIRAYGIEVLGVIPDMEKMEERRARHRTNGRPETTALLNAKGRSETLVALLNPLSVTADAYRRALVNIHVGRTDDPLRSILVTSAEAQVGKSTTALNLALTGARSGKRTVLVDADLYRPTIYKHLALEDGVDITALLTGRDFDPETLRVPDIDDFHVIGTKKPLPNAVEVIGSQAMYWMLDRLQEMFDLVIVDSPPILLATGPRMLSRRCDATVLVVKAGSTDGDALQHISLELKDAGVSALGALLNRFNPDELPGYQSTYGYRQNHYSQYYTPV